MTPDHTTQTATGWILGEHAIPARTIAHAWAERRWRDTLADALITDHRGTAGLLWAVDDDHLTVVNLDGEESAIPVEGASAVSLPHPMRTEELPDWRNLAAEFSVTQGLDQLLRETHPKPADRAEQDDQLHSARGARFASFPNFASHCRAGGFTVTRTSSAPGAYTEVTEAGEKIRAFLPARDDAASPRLGSLLFLRRGHVIPAADVGPVAWSEGMRMARHLHDRSAVT